jgi:hypothetical protein
MAKESLESDFENRLITPQEYIAKIESYIKYENRNLKNAKKDKLDSDHIIMIE